MRYQVETMENGRFMVLDTLCVYLMSTHDTHAEALVAAMTMEQQYTQRKRQDASYYHGPSNVAGPTNREYWELLDLEAQEREDRYYEARGY